MKMIENSTNNINAFVVIYYYIVKWNTDFFKQIYAKET